MAITLNLKPEIEARLIALAHQSGVSMEDYLLAVLESNVSHSRKMLSPEELASAWRKTAKRFPDTPLLSDGAVSRESMYADGG